MSWYRMRSRRAADRERGEEMRSHIDLYVDEAMARGLTEQDAQREARLRFGNPRVKREEVDALERIPVLETAGHDIRTAVRSLRSAPGFTTTVLIVLTLAMGATTAVFSIVDAVVLRPMPFPRPDRIVALGYAFQGRVASFPLSAPQLLALDAQSDLFESIAATTNGNISLRRDGPWDAEILRGQKVTASLFSVLRVSPKIGHLFTRENEMDGHDRVAVISAALWKRRFDNDPNVVGRRLPGASGDLVVVGVMPADFAYPVGAPTPTQLWTPYVVSASERAGNGSSHYLQTIARLRAGATLASSQARLNALVPVQSGGTPQGVFTRPIALAPLQDAVVGSTRAWALLVLAAMTCVLLIACVNIANLMLVRATVRTREFGVRSALGASTWQLVRMLLAEGLLLSAIGTSLGLAVAWWVVEASRSMLPTSLPRVGDVAINMRVFAVAAGAALVTGIVFGLAPAVRGSTALGYVLKQEGRGTTLSRRRLWIRSAFLTTQVALAVVLVLGAVLFLTSFGRLMAIDLGLDYRHVTTVDVRPSAAAATPDRLTRLAESVARIPEVDSAALATANLPYSLGTSVRLLSRPGVEQPFPLETSSISPGFFRALRVAVRRGRAFLASDTAGSEGVVILNESAARKIFPNVDPIGRSLDGDRRRTVIGVVADARTFDPERAPEPAAFIPFAQDTHPAGTLVVRTVDASMPIDRQIKEAILAEFPDLVLAPARPLASSFDGLIAQRRFNVLLLGLFGALGITIAAVGIFGVTNYAVAQRTREIGIRMALGAVSASIVWAVLKRTSFEVALGLAIGLGLAWVLSKSVASFLFSVQPHEPQLYVVVAGILAVAAIAAATIPARRATRVDPVVALRIE